MKAKLLIPLWTVLLLGLAGCASSSGDWEGDNSITQVSTLDALASGIYEGGMPVSELSRYGDTGIGTFDGLDGEMLIVDGKVYKVRADGKVYMPSAGEMTPFAAVTRFNPDTILLINDPTDWAGLQARIDRETTKKNFPVVIRIEGDFEMVKTRSVPKQIKPYPPLVKVTRQQAEFTIKNVSGVIVGFRMPGYVRGMNMPGYHCHFISDERDCGGHLLNLRMKSGKIFLATSDRVTLILPRNVDSFINADLSKDRKSEIQQAENQH